MRNNFDPEFGETFNFFLHHMQVWFIYCPTQNSLPIAFYFNGAFHLLPNAEKLAHRVLFQWCGSFTAERRTAGPSHFFPLVP